MRRGVATGVAVGIVGAFVLACTGDGEGGGGVGDDWFVEQVSLGHSGLHYAEVSGTITLNSVLASSLGAQAKVSYYSDDYKTLLDTVERRIGGDLEEVGQTQQFDLISIEVYLTPAIGGLDRVCVELTVEDSNYGETTQVGCVNGE